VAASSIVPPLQTAVLLWAVCFALILLIAVLNTAIAVSALNGVVRDAKVVHATTARLLQLLQQAVPMAITITAV
jgi:hypothetical protein